MKLLNEFVVKGTPDTTTAQQKGVRVIGRRVMFYKKPEVVQAERWLWQDLLCYSPTEPYEGPLYVRVMWLFDKKSLASQLVKIELTKAWSKEYPGLFFQIWKLTDEDYAKMIDEWRDGHGYGF